MSLAKKGVAGVSIDYRLMGGGGQEIANGTFDRAMEDISDAYEWVRQNAEKYGFDTEKVGIGGSSAGGHLSAIFAQRQKGIKVYVGICGTYDLLSTRKERFPRTGRQEKYGIKGEEAQRKASAIYNIRKEPAMTLLMHGTDDKSIDYGQAVRYAEALKKKGGIVKLELFDGLGHSFFKQSQSSDHRALDVLVEFVTSVMGASDGKTCLEGDGFRLIPNMPFLGDNRNEMLDVYLPAKERDGDLPAIVYIHGGGWAIGHRATNRARSICSTLAREGYAVFSIEYLLTKYQGQPFKSKRLKGAWPQNIYDCKTAVRYVRKNASVYNIDPERIGVIGCSAGGHLALLVGLSSGNDELNSGGLYTDYPCDVKCVVDMYGIPDVRLWGGGFIEADKVKEPGIWAMASPVTHLSEKAPPMLIIHGDKDTTVGIEQSLGFVEILKEKNLAHEFVVVEGGVHGFNLEPKQMDLRPKVFGFFEKYLKNPSSLRAKD